MSTSLVPASEMPFPFPLMHQCTLAGLLQTLLESSPIAVVALDANHQFSAANPAFHALFGYSAECLLASDFDSAITTPETRDGARQLSAAVMQGRRVSASAQRRRSDGQVIDLEITGIPLLEEGRLAGVYGLYRRSALGAASTRQDLRSISENIHTLQHSSEGRCTAGEQLNGVSAAAKLTGREQEVLRQLAHGKSSKNIASELRIGVRTVESHRASINQKCGFRSFADLIRFAVLSQG